MLPDMALHLPKACRQSLRMAGNAVPRLRRSYASPIAAKYGQRVQERLQKYARELDAFDKIIAIDAKQADAWFGECRLLLTVVEDPARGLDALSKALEAGFHDQAAVKALLGSSELLDRDKVEGLLKDHNQFPAPDAPAPGTPSGASAPGTAAPAAPPSTGSPAAPPVK